MSSLRIAATAATGLLLSAYSVVATAQGPAPQGPAPTAGFGFVLEGVAEFGGDEVATVYFEDGDDQDVKTGQGVTAAVGGHYRTAGFSYWDFRATGGYKYVTTKADNADINISRLVWEVAADYVFPNKWWLGGGITHHSGIELDGDGYFEDVEFDDATGYTLEAGWSFIGVSYTGMDYKAYGETVDASNFGVFLIWKI